MHYGIDLALIGILRLDKNITPTHSLFVEVSSSRHESSILIYLMSVFVYCYHVGLAELVSTFWGLLLYVLLGGSLRYVALIRTWNVVPRQSSCDFVRILELWVLFLCYLYCPCIRVLIEFLLLNEVFSKLLRLNWHNVELLRRREVIM